jgi:hypothetical protein
MPTQDQDRIRQMDRIWHMTEMLGGFEDLSDEDLLNLQLAIARELRLRERKKLAAGVPEAARGDMMMGQWGDVRGAVRVSRLDGEEGLRGKKQ